MTKLESRKFVNKLDFMSSPGYLDGTPGAREQAGMPANTGPYKIITQEAVFDFDGETHQMRLIAMMPWMTVEQVLSKMEFEPLIADKVERMEPPTDEELTIIRAQIDPGGLTVSRGEWIAIDRETGQRAQ
jgi:glutaconate CoA-transferase subunit B